MNKYNSIINYISLLFIDVKINTFMIKACGNLCFLLPEIN